MGKKTPPHIVQLQAEGTKADRDLVRKWEMNEAKKLANSMPTFGPDRIIYVRNLTTKALRGELDKEVFKRFVRMTNSYIEVEACFPRAKLLSGKERSR